MPKKQTLEEFIKKSNIAHNFKYNYDKSIYINKQTKVIVICPENKCSGCEFVRKAHEEFLDNRD